MVHAVPRTCPEVSSKEQTNSKKPKTTNIPHNRRPIPPIRAYQINHNLHPPHNALQLLLIITHHVHLHDLHDPQVVDNIELELRDEVREFRAGAPGDGECERAAVAVRLEVARDEAACVACATKEKYGLVE